MVSPRQKRRRAANQNEEAINNMDENKNIPGTVSETTCGETPEGSFVLPADGRLYVIVETDGKCLDGEFEFNIA